MTFWNGTCHYCGNKIIGVGLDRIDSSIGYTIENCVPCCKDCNIMKNAKGYDEFIQKCKQIVKNLEQIG
jgi:5-methylcytosine-specific restriction endonuclease McrA